MSEEDDEDSEGSGGCGGGATVAVLVDTQVGAAQGGTGAVCDWGVARRLSEAEGGFPVLVAGGLNPANVAAATEAFSGAPILGIDASSGLESSPGVKDRAAIATFVKGALKSRD